MPGYSRLADGCVSVASRSGGHVLALRILRTAVAGRLMHAIDASLAPRLWPRRVALTS